MTNNLSEILACQPIKFSQSYEEISNLHLSGYLIYNEEIMFDMILHNILSEMYFFEIQ